MPGAWLNTMSRTLRTSMTLVARSGRRKAAAMPASSMPMPSVTAWNMSPPTRVARPTPARESVGHARMAGPRCHLAEGGNSVGGCGLPYSIGPDRGWGRKITAGCCGHPAMLRWTCSCVLAFGLEPQLFPRLGVPVLRLVRVEREGVSLGVVVAGLVLDDDLVLGAEVVRDALAVQPRARRRAA